MKFFTLFILFTIKIVYATNTCCQNLYFTSNDREIPHGIIGPWNSFINESVVLVNSMVGNHSLQRKDGKWSLDHYRQNNQSQWAETDSSAECPEKIPSK